MIFDIDFQKLRFSNVYLVALIVIEVETHHCSTNPDIMEYFNKRREIKVAPTISYVADSLYSNVDSSDPKQIPSMSEKKDSDRDVRDEIDNEALDRELVAQKRYQTYKTVLFGRPDNNVPYTFIFYNLSCTALSVAVTSIYTLIPIHNMLAEPQYWWETLLQVTAGFTSISCAYTLLNCSYWTNISFLRTMRNFWMYYLAVAIFMLTITTACAMGWSYGLKLPTPMPFYGMIMAYAVGFCGFIPLWYRFPSNWRKEKDIWRKFKFFILAIIINFGVTLTYTMYTKALLAVSLQYQWTVAVFLIPLRNFNVWLQTKVGYEAAGVQDASIAITCSHNMNNRHCFFLSVVLGTIATDVTCWVILAIDFCINIFFVLKISWTKWKNGFNQENGSRMVEMLLELIINETVETIVPFTYLVCFLIAYYGPNAELIGTVKSEYWHHIPVEDIGRFIGNLGLFVLVDCIGLITTYVIFLVVCKIDVLRAFASLQKEYWFLFAVNTAYLTTTVSSLDIIYIESLFKLFMRCKLIDMGYVFF